MSLQDPPGTFPALSRRFLSFHRSSLFRTVKISSASQFASLIRSLRSNPDNLNLVDALELHLPSFLQSRSSGIRKMNQLSFLFCSLVNLRKLCIRSCQHTCDLFICHARYVNPLLQHLHLEYIRTESSSDSYWSLDPSFLDTISIYSNLRHLGLVRLELPEVSDSPSPSPSTVLRFPNLTSLELGGDLTPLAVQDLFSRCSPTSIVLVEDCEEDEWFPNIIPAILAKVEEPKLVKKLVLDSQHHIETEGLWYATEGYINIEDLTFEREASSLDQLFCQILERLPLLKLAFGPATTVDGGELVYLFNNSDRDRFGAIRTLVLDQIQAERGDDVDPRTWKLPDWPVDFDFYDCMGIILIARQEQGVNVIGRTIDSYEIEMEYRGVVERWNDAVKQIMREEGLLEEEERPPWADAFERYMQARRERGSLEPESDSG